MTNKINDAQSNFDAVQNAPLTRNPNGDRVLRGANTAITLGARDILNEAETLVTGERNADYGAWTKDAEKIAAMWTVILNHTILPEQVADCMVALKLVRNTVKRKRDNAVDIAGYAAIGAAYLAEE